MCIPARYGSWTLVTACLLIPLTALTAEQPQDKPASKTQVVLLGTGNPNPDPDRSGPATAIVVNGTPYLVDFCAGVVRRAKGAVAETTLARYLRRPVVDNQRSRP